MIARAWALFQKGYLDVYIYDSWKGNMIPVFVEGRRYRADTFALRTGTTTSPTRLSQNELIKVVGSTHTHTHNN